MQNQIQNQTQKQEICKEYTVSQFLEKVRLMNVDELKQEHDSIVSYENYFDKHQQNPLSSLISYLKRVPSTKNNLHYEPIYKKLGKYASALSSDNTDGISDFLMDISSTSNVIDGKNKLIDCGSVVYDVMQPPSEDLLSQLHYYMNLQKKNLNVLIYFVKDAEMIDEKKDNRLFKNVLDINDPENYKQYDNEFNNSQYMSEYFDYNDVLIKDGYVDSDNLQVNFSEDLKQKIKNQRLTKNNHLNSLIKNMEKIQGTEHVYCSFIHNEQIEDKIIRLMIEMGLESDIIDFGNNVTKTFKLDDYLYKDGEVNTIDQIIDGLKATQQNAKTNILVETYLKRYEEKNQGNQQSLALENMSQEPLEIYPEKGIHVIVFKGFDANGNVKSLDDFHKLYQLVFTNLRESQVLSAHYAQDPEYLPEDVEIKIGLQSGNGADKVGTFLMTDILIRRFVHFERMYQSYFFRINVCEMMKNVCKFHHSLVRNINEYKFIYIYLYVFINKIRSKLIQQQNLELKKNYSMSAEEIKKRYNQISLQILNKILYLK